MNDDVSYDANISNTARPKADYFHLSARTSERTHVRPPRRLCKMDGRRDRNQHASRFSPENVGAELQRKERLSFDAFLYFHQGGNDYLPEHGAAG